MFYAFRLEILVGVPKPSPFNSLNLLGSGAQPQVSGSGPRLKWLHGCEPAAHSVKVDGIDKISGMVQGQQQPTKAST